MSTFAVSIKKIIAVEPHLNADRLELATIEGYYSVILKGQYKAGDLVAYLPEAAVLPRFVLDTLQLWDTENDKGKLAGKEGARVKAVRLRGELSQGICYPLSYQDDHAFGAGWYLQDADSTLWKVSEGEDVATVLGVAKYSPVIPACLAGEVWNAGLDRTVSYDIDNIKSFPDVLQADEAVVMTEKIHGTFTGFGIFPVGDEGESGRFGVFSKGLGALGLCFKDNEANVKNAYIRMLKVSGFQEKLLKLEALVIETLLGGIAPSSPIFLLGETFGSGTKQDLGYAAQLAFRAFDLVVPQAGYPQAVAYEKAQALAAAAGIDWVPLIYRGPLSSEALAMATSGRETVSGKLAHIREGVVVRPEVERRDSTLGRVILKSVSPDYLVRKGEATEYT
jgi:RNA ligase (TIGR02306 family)